MKTYAVITSTESRQYPEPFHRPSRTDTIEYKGFRMSISEYQGLLKQRVRVVVHLPDCSRGEVIFGTSTCPPHWLPNSLPFRTIDDALEDAIEATADEIDKYRAREEDTTIEDAARRVLEGRQ